MENLNLNAESSATQCARIKAHLESGKSITGMEALNLFGCWSLPRRILDLKECAENFGLEVVGCRPLLKVWKGKDRKITHEEAAYFMRGLPKQTNQESRDAALLAWAYADFPIRVK